MEQFTNTESYFKHTCHSAALRKGCIIHLQKTVSTRENGGAAEVMTLSPLCQGLCTRDVELREKHEQQSWSHPGSSGSHKSPECCHRPPLHAPGEREKKKHVVRAIITDQSDQLNRFFSTFISGIRWVKNWLLGQCHWLAAVTDENNLKGHKCASTATYGGKKHASKVGYVFFFFKHSYFWEPWTEQLPSSYVTFRHTVLYVANLLCQTPGVSDKATGSDLQRQS